MSAEIKLRITELPEGLRAVIREGQALVIKDAGEDIIQVKTYRRWRGKRIPKTEMNKNKLMVQRPIGMLAKPKKALRPIGVLVGKLPIPTEEEFTKYDSEILSILC
ncbi:hypothetical protein [Xenorhabdus japonica]|uniref:Uncharacterized protein n=1 Tax=Xenorhabdus japonica TaxID=53341 RepID=A0A1I5DCQ3_9GAMM|nr:hypothetical protein [Xenorhabdus japonica]SFN96916.1 hypothetical protein SAMN05421579_13815 [Xenorhabdus japonica]